MGQSTILIEASDIPGTAIATWKLTRGNPALGPIGIQLANVIDLWVAVNHHMLNGKFNRESNRRLERSQRIT